VDGVDREPVSTLQLALEVRFDSLPRRQERD
jgi:hypothetical protein